MPQPKQPLFNLDDPMLFEAKRVIHKLSERGITVFHNPTYGIMLMGTGVGPESSSPSTQAMNEAYALHNEIAMLFAIQSVSKTAQSMSVCNKILGGIMSSASPEGAARSAA